MPPAVTHAVVTRQVGARLRGGDEVVDGDAGVAVRQLHGPHARAEILELPHARVEGAAHLGVNRVAEKMPRHAHSNAANVAGEGGERRWSRDLGRCRVTRVRAGDRVETECRVLDGARERPRSDRATTRRR